MCLIAMLNRAKLTKAALSRKLLLSAAETNSSLEVPKIMGDETRFTLPSYNSPIAADMAVILAFFNPVHSVRIFQNLLTIKTLLERASIPVFIGEVAFEEQPFVLPSAHNVFQWKSSSHMFYKENIFNAVLRIVPASYTKIMMLDCDVVFEDPDWYNAVSKDLDKFSVIQPFQTAHFLNSDFTLAKSMTSYAKSPTDGHVGFAAAFQRSWLATNGLYDLCLVGSGDAHLMYYFHNTQHNCYTDFRIDYTAWCNSKPSHALGYSELTVYHLPHGNDTNRQYVDRHAGFLNIVRQFRLQKISELVQQSEEGIYDWKPEFRRVMNSFMKRYFNTRNDDGI
jgi:hypothetical protein